MVDVFDCFPLLLVYSIDSFNDAAAGVYRCNVQYGQSSVNGYLDAKIFGAYFQSIISMQKKRSIPIPSHPSV